MLPLLSNQRDRGAEWLSRHLEDACGFLCEEMAEPTDALPEALDDPDVAYAVSPRPR